MFLRTAFILAGKISDKKKCKFFLLSFTRDFIEIIHIPGFDVKICRKCSECLNFFSNMIDFFCYFWRFPFTKYMMKISLWISCLVIKIHHFKTPDKMILDINTSDTIGVRLKKILFWQKKIIIDGPNFCVQKWSL